MLKTCNEKKKVDSVFETRRKRQSEKSQFNKQKTKCKVLVQNANYHECRVFYSVQIEL